MPIEIINATNSLQSIFGYQQEILHEVKKKETDVRIEKTKI